MSLQQRIEEDDHYLDLDSWLQDAANLPEPEQYEPNDEEAVTASDISSYVELTPEEQYEAMAACSEHDEVGTAYHYRPPPTKPMFCFETFKSGEPMDYEYVVEGLLRFGHNAWSGPRGSGKTSTLIPLLLAIAGLTPHYPLPIKLRRQVLMVTEDAEQVWMVIRGMIADGYLRVSEQELNDWFHVSHASRLSTSDIVNHGTELEKMKVPNARTYGAPFPAGPLLVMDTVSACIDTENSSSNDEVAADVEEIKSKLKHTSVLLVGHTAKDSSGKGQTFLGAQAWEGNTIGSVTLKVKDNGDRELVVNKNRFSAQSPRFKIIPKFVTFPGKDVLGHDTMITSLYNLIEPMTQEDIEASQEADKAAKEAQQRVKDSDELLAKLTGMLGERNPDGSLVFPDGVTKGQLYKRLDRKPTNYVPIIAELNGKKIEVVPHGTADLITLKNDMEVV